MADYKDYIVRYDIQADVTKATEGLNQIAEIATRFEKPMATLKEAISTLNSSLINLKANSQFVFEPKIDVSMFQRQLAVMQNIVHRAAAQMQADLNNALSGSPAARQAATRGTTQRTSKQIEDDIKRYEEQVKKIGGITKKGTDLYYARNAGNTQAEQRLQIEAKALKQQIAARKAELAEMQKLEQEVAATAKKSGGTVVSTGKNVPKVANVTPETIKAWSKFFGNAKAKQMTVTIRGNASGAGGALTVIAEVQSALKKLQASANFTINPKLNAKSFAAAESQLTNLGKLGKKASRGTAIGGKGNQVTIPVTAQVMTDQIAASLKSIPRPILPVDIQPNVSALTEQLKTMKRLTLPVNMKLGWEKGAVGKNAQLKGIQEKIPPIKLVLDTSGAVAALEAFILKVRESSPQNVALTATGTTAAAGAATGGTAVAAGTSGGGKKAGTYTAAQINKMTRAAMMEDNLAEMKRISDQITANEKAAQQSVLMHNQRQAELQKTFDEHFARQSKASIARHATQAKNIRAGYSNQMLPFVSSQAQLNTALKYHRYFAQAQRTTGITPAPGMSPFQMWTYMNGVMTQMQKNNVAIPLQMQKYMSGLQKSMNASGPIVPMAPAAPKMALYDRMRKGLYRFTGNTSFGARTPMAVDMAKGMGVMFAIGGAMSAIGDSFSQAVQYQNTMKTAQAILKNGTDSYTDVGFKEMEKIVRNVGVETKFTAPQVADAARYLAMAGADINTINSAIRPIADIALIGDNDLGEIADKMTNVLTTFKISPDKMRPMANVLANTFTRTNTDMLMLAESAKYAGGIAQLYGGNYENNFADVMALIGIMGNSGIQASAAGTTLRMIYQNLMQPNKKQQAILDDLRAKYGIHTRDENGRPLEMSRILTQLSNIPQEQIPDVVGKLFRITAQPGAAAILNDLTGGDETLKQSAIEASDWLANNMSGKTGSKLLELMIANRNAAQSSISENIATEKKGTIAGLWAQVASTFTEGIVKAFEGKEGYFTTILAQLRDYLAKPETVRILNNVLDLVIELGKLMGWFVDKWVKIYELAPNLVKDWMWVQMFFNQIGMLMTPMVAMVGVVAKLRDGIVALNALFFGSAAASSGAVAATATGAAGASAAADAVLAGSILASGRTGGRVVSSPFMMGKTITTKGTFRTQAATYRAAASKWDAAIAAAMASTYGLSPRAIKSPVQRNWIANDAEVIREMGGTKGTVYGYGDKRIAYAVNAKRRNLAAAAEAERNFAAVKARANQIYGTGARMSRAFSAGRAAGALTDGIIMASLWPSIKHMFSNIGVMMAKAAGLITSPVGLIVAGLAAVGTAIYGIYDNWKRYNQQVQMLSDNLMIVNEQSKQIREQRIQAGINAGAGIVNIGYEKAIDKSNTTYALEQNSIVKQLLGDDIDKLSAGNIYRLNGGFTKYFDQSVIDHYNASYSPVSGPWASAQILDWINSARFGTKKDFAKRMAMTSQWMRMAIEQPEVSKAMQDIYDALYVRGKADEAREILSEFKPDKNSPRMMDIDDVNDIAGIANPTSYYEWQSAQYKMLEELFGDGSPLQRYAAAVEEIASIQENNGSFVKQASSLIPNLLGSVYTNYKGNKGQLTFNSDGSINWGAFAELVNNGEALSYKERVRVLNSVYDTLVHDPKIGGIQTIVDLLSAYLPSMANKPSSVIVMPGVPNNIYNRPNFNDPNRGKVKKNRIDTAVRLYGKEAVAAALKAPKGKQTAEQREILKNIDAPITQEEINAVSTPKITSPTATPPKTTNQNDYSSHYDRAAARPTQVVINIDKLANFDRTAIASGAEERDLIAAMENKITEAVYQLFATASNNANNIMNMA